MLSREELANKPFLQIILILSLCLVSLVIMTGLGGILAYVFFDFNPNTPHNMAQLAGHEIEGYKLLQLFGALGLFILPPLVFAKISHRSPLHFLGLKTAIKPINYLLVFLLIFALAPFISWFIGVNEQLILPEFLAGMEQWMISKQSDADLISTYFLDIKDLGSLFYMLLVVALIPAIGEELLFRGVLQKMTIAWTKNPHLGIWITAFVFSAIHLQFFGFFPRMLMGLLLGYLFFWSKSLWLPILGHFINNGSVVMASYFFPKMMNDSDYSLFEESPYVVVFYVGSFILSVIIFYFIRKMNQNWGENNQIRDATSV